MPKPSPTRTLIVSGSSWTLFCSDAALESAALLLFECALLIQTELDLSGSNFTAAELETICADFLGHSRRRRPRCIGVNAALNP